jgi:hypothetical protein
MKHKELRALAETGLHRKSAGTGRAARGIIAGTRPTSLTTGRTFSMFRVLCATLLAICISAPADAGTDLRRNRAKVLQVFDADTGELEFEIAYRARVARGRRFRTAPRASVM